MDYSCTMLSEEQKNKILKAKYRSRGKRGEAIVRSRLNPGFSRNPIEHRYIPNLILLDNCGHSYEIDCIEIRHNGVFCIEVKNYIGCIVGGPNDSNWLQITKFGSRPLPNPVIQNKIHCEQVDRTLNYEHIVNSVVVMVQDNIKNIKGCPNVVKGCKLRKYLDTFDNGVYLSLEEMDYIYNALLEADSELSLEEHIHNINNY